MKLKLKLKLIILFSGIMCISLGLLSMIYFNNAREIIVKNKMQELHIISGMKTKQINLYFDFIGQQIAIAQDYFNVKKNLPALSEFLKDRSSVEYSQSERMLDDQLLTLINELKIYDLMLIDSLGKIVYTVNKAHGKQIMGNHLDSVSPELFKEGQIDIYFSNIFRHKTAGIEYSMYVSAPVYDFEGSFIGLLAFILDMAPIYDLIQDNQSIGRTGETLMGRNEGDHALFLNPLKYDKEAAFQRKVYYNENKALPMRLATQGFSGMGLTALDYRGESVIASWRPFYIGSQLFGLVNKIDHSEALEVIYRLRTIFITILCVILFFSIGIVFVNALAITGPIDILRRSALMIAKGDFSSRIKDIETEDEIGELADTFNIMVEQLQKTTVSHDELVKEIEQRKIVEKEFEQQKIAALNIAEDADKAREEAVEAADKVANIIKTANEAFISIDQKGNIIEWNPKAEATFGWSRDSVLGSPLHKIIISAVHREAHQKGITHFLSTGEAPALNKLLELTAVRRDGKEISVELTISNQKTKQGHILNVFLRDITKRKENERDLQIQKQALERSNQELEQFAFIASHDLQEPLRMVASYVQLLAKKYQDKLDENAKEYIAFAVDGANRMRQLIDDLLSYSRVQTKGHEFTNFSMGDAYKKALENLSIVIAEKKAQITSDPLPSLKADETQMVQLLQNLINNALKFQREDVIRVHVGVKEVMDCWQFSVTDNGIGIDKQYLEKIFIIFKRLHTATQYPGTGIGLAVCKRIVERHQGRIWAESELGKGSAFYFTISKQVI